MFVTQRYIPPKAEIGFQALACAVRGHGHLEDAEAIAAREYGETVHKELKALVEPFVTYEAPGSVLASADSISAMGAYLIEPSVLGKMSKDLREIPLNTRVINGSVLSASFRKQGEPFAFVEGSISETGLPVTSIGGGAVYTREVEEFGEKLEGLLIDDMSTSVSEAADEAFLDPTNAGITDEKPKSVTNGVTAVTATSDPVADFKSIIADFGGNLSKTYVVSTPTIFASIAGRDFPDVGANGGSVLGLRAIASRKAPAGTVILIDASGVSIADGGLEVDISKEASIQMRDDPVSGAITLVSMFQSNLIGVIVRKYLNWAVSRPGSVSMLSGVSW